MSKLTKPRSRRPRPPARLLPTIPVLFLIVAALCASEARIEAQVSERGVNFTANSTFAGAIDGVASADGEWVYVPAFLRDVIVVFRRDRVTGLLASTEAAEHWVGDSNLIDGPVHLELTSTGEDLYVASLEGNNITHWNRSTSGIDFGSVAPGVAGQSGIEGPAALALNQDETELWAVGLSDDRLFVYPRGPDGTLGVPTSVTLTSGARDVVFSPDGTFAYIADFGGDALIVVENTTNGPVQRQRITSSAIGANLDGPYDISVSPDGNDVYLAEFLGGAVHHFSRLSSGLLAHQSRTSSAQIGTLTGAFSVHVTNDGKQLIVSGGIEPGTLHVFNRGPDGSLQLQQVLDSTSTSVGALEHPAGLWQAGASIYWADLASGSVGHARGAGGPLTPAEVQSTMAFSTHHMTVTADPALLYSFESEYNFATPLPLVYRPVFRDPTTGGLSAGASDTLPYSVLQTPTDVASTNDRSDAYLTFNEGALIQVDLRGPIPHLGSVFDNGAAGLDSPTQVVLAPDDQHLYVASQDNSAIVHFERSLVTGGLTARGTALLNQPPRSLEPSRDGAHLYAMTKNMVVVFQRDAATGTLLHLSSISTTDAAQSNSNTALSLSSDGRHLYVAANLGSIGRAQLQVYARSASQGNLTVLQTLTKTVDSSVSDMMLIQDDNRLLLSDWFNQGTTVYKRDLATGLLAFESIEGEGARDPTLFLEGPLVASTDNRHIYSIGIFGTTILSLDGIFSDGFESGNSSQWR